MASNSSASHSTAPHSTAPHSTAPHITYTMMTMPTKMTIISSFEAAFVFVAIIRTDHKVTVHVERFRMFRDRFLQTGIGIQGLWPLMRTHHQLAAVRSRCSCLCLGQATTSQTTIPPLPISLMIPSRIDHRHDHRRKRSLIARQTLNSGSVMLSPGRTVWC